jgi:hypothetical protein
LKDIQSLVDFVNEIEVPKPKAKAKPKASSQPKVEDNRLVALEEKMERILEALASSQPKVESKPKASPKPKVSTRKKPKASTKASPSERVADQQEKASYGVRKDGFVKKQTQPKVADVTEGQKSVREMEHLNKARKQAKLDSKAKTLGITLLDGESPQDAIRRMKIEREHQAKLAEIKAIEDSLLVNDLGQMEWDF